MAAAVVLITGTSSGIGRALGWAFHQQGFEVVATARRLAAIADLKAAGMCTWQLDVTQTNPCRPSWMQPSQSWGALISW